MNSEPEVEWSNFSAPSREFCQALLELHPDWGSLVSRSDRPEAELEFRVPAPRSRTTSRLVTILVGPETVTAAFDLWHFHTRNDPGTVKSFLKFLDELLIEDWVVVSYVTSSNRLVCGLMSAPEAVKLGTWRTSNPDVEHRLELKNEKPPSHQRMIRIRSVGGTFSRDLVKWRFGPWKDAPIPD